MGETDSKETSEQIIISSASQKEQSLPLGLGDGRLLELFAQKLEGYVPTPDIQVILSDLRDELFDGLVQESIEDLHAVTKICRKCPNLEADPQIPPWNKTDPDCLFIMDGPTNNKEILSCIVACLASSKFSSKRVCLTYTTRCRSLSSKITDFEVQNCFNYLRTEIQILKPKLIVAMGVLSASTLLGTNIKLNENHGKIFWLGPWAIMPTFSPAYVVMAGTNQKDIFSQDLEYAYKYCYGDTK